MYKPYLMGRPGWVLPGASADFSFMGGRYFAQGGANELSSVLSTSRASTGLAQTSGGSWVSFPANTPRITDQGLLVEEARTNLFLNSNAPATQNVTLGTGTYIVTVWGASGSVTTSAGTATATGYGAISAAPTGTRQTLTVTGAGTVTCTVSGSPLYVQVELGAFGTSPIITAGAAATRAADVISLTGAAATAALAAKAARFETNLGQGIASTARLIDYNGAQRAYFPATTQVGITDNTNSATANLGSGSYSGIVKVAYGFDNSSLTAVANGGAKATQTPSVWGAPSGPVYLATNSAGNRALNGYMRRCSFGPTKGMFDRLTS